MFNMPPASIPPRSTKYLLFPFIFRKPDRAVHCPVCSGPSDGHFRCFHRLWVEWGCDHHFLFHVSSRLSSSCMTGAMIWWYGVFLQSWPLPIYSCSTDFCHSVYKSLLLFATGCQLNPAGVFMPTFSDIPFKPVLWDYNDDTSHLQSFPLCHISMFQSSKCKVTNISATKSVPALRWVSRGNTVGKTGKAALTLSLIFSFFLLPTSTLIDFIQHLLPTAKILRGSLHCGTDRARCCFSLSLPCHTHLAVVFQNALFMLLSRMDRASSPHVEEQLTDC